MCTIIKPTKGWNLFWFYSDLWDWAALTCRNAKALEISSDFKSGDLKGCCLPYKSSEITWFRNFFFVSWFKKFGIAETTIRLNRLYDKNTTVLQKWREKEPSGSLSLPPSSVRLPTPVSACPSLCDYIGAFWGSYDYEVTTALEDELPALYE